MFRFRELSLWNWDYWAAIRIPLDREVVLLSGPNGSGKTTFLDAIRQVLHAPRLSSRRRLQHYLRRPDVPAILRAVVSNEDVGFGQPFRRERLTMPEVTLACALVPSSTGSPEKRFAVLPGRASLDELRGRLLETRGEFYAPERYARVLEQAGVSRSLMNVLALEQGKTNSLFEKTPRALLQDVLEMMGDRAVLERYREARRRYEESEREVSRQAGDLQRSQIELNRVAREVARLDEWERAAAKVAELEERIPAARLQAALRRRAEASQKLPELRTKVKNGETERVLLTRDQLEAEATARTASDSLADAQRAVLEAQTSLEEGSQVVGVLTSEVAVLARDEAELVGLPVRSIPELEAAVCDAARARTVAEGRLLRAEGDEREARGRLARIEAGFPTHPEPVESMLKALQARGIAFSLLAQTMDPVDRVAPGLEAALGDARWALAVLPTDEPGALAAAAETGFPGPIWSGSTLTAAKESESVRLAPGTPSWVEGWLANAAEMPDGAWKDERGSWVARPIEPALGERAREAAAAAARGRVTDLTGAMAEARGALEIAAAAHDRLSSTLGEQQRRIELADRVHTLGSRRQALEHAEQSRRLARALLQEKTAEASAAQVLLQRARAEAERAEHGLADLDRRLEGETKALRDLESNVLALDAEIGDLERAVSPVLRARAEHMELDGVETLEGDLRRAREALTAMGERPDPSVREEARHLKANVEEAERHVRARADEAARARSELSECRTRYLEVVHGSLQDYKRRAVDVARGATVSVEMDLPRLLDDDRALDEAELVVRFGFDGKDPLPLGDSSFSGGQQVICGLVLLMAMVEGAGRGFFMLDEPFAHLSIDRIDDVGRFLRSSGAQFLITAPTTLDRAQLDPASLVITTRKKRPGEPHAPVPLVAEA